MIDEDAQPTRVTVLKGDVRPPPREGGWSESSRGLMIGILATIAGLSIAVVTLLAVLAHHGIDSLREQRRTNEAQTRALGQRRVEEALNEDRRMAETSVQPSDPATWITSDDYPPSALRANEEGTVTITWVATPDGRISDCKTLQTSGHASLDSAACSAIERRGRYVAVPVAQGMRVFTRRVVWKIPS